MDAMTNNLSLISSSNFAARQFNAAPTGDVAVESPVADAGTVQDIAGETLAGAGLLADQWSLLLGGTVAVIDDFVAEADGFNHGEEIANLIQNGAAQAGIQLDTLRLNVDDGTNDRVSAINRSLDQVIGKVLDGEDITAVNLSQQSTTLDFGTIGTNFRLAALEALGVPTVVAAGNNGPEAPNTLAFGSSFVVENSAAGSEERAATSGPGNVRAEGAFTSQATTNVTFRAAALRAAGLNIPQIAELVNVQAAGDGGSLNAPAAPSAAPVEPAPPAPIQPIGPIAPPAPTEPTPEGPLTRREVRQARLAERREVRAERIETRVAAREVRQEARAAARTERRDQRAAVIAERVETRTEARTERQVEVQAAQAQREQAAAAATARAEVRQDAREAVVTQRQELRAAVQAERTTARSLRQEARAERVEARAELREARQAARAEAQAPAPAPATTAFTGTSFSPRMFFGPSFVGPTAPVTGPFARA